MALLLNGTTDYLTLASPLVTTPPLSFACWINLSDSTISHAVMALSRKTTQNDHYALFVAGNSAHRAQTAIAGVVTQAAVTPPVANVWKHVVAVFSTTTSRAVYVNGTQATDATSSAFGTVDNTSLGCYFLGSSTAGTLMKGIIAYPAIWNVALAQADVNALFGSVSKGADPRTVQPSALVSFSLLYGPGPYQDSFTKGFWTTNGAPTPAADPFQIQPLITHGGLAE